MSAKPEAQYRGRIHKMVDKQKVYIEGMANPYRGGTPDTWYDGLQCDLWVEWKYLKTIPPIIDLTDSKKQVCLSKLQIEWLTRAYGNGRNVAVIVGSSEGGLILRDMAWMHPIPRDFFKERALPARDIAAWITSEVGRSPDAVYRQTHSFSGVVTRRQLLGGAA